MPRFFLSELPAIGESVCLPLAVAHHVLRVLRARVGERLEVFDGAGTEALVELTEIHGKQAHAQVISRAAISRESRLHLVLAQGLCSADKMDWVIEKAVELGVQAIQPLQTEKSVLRLDAERATRKQQHWQEIVCSACAQSGRNLLPTLLPLRTLPDWLATAAPIWLFSPRATQPLSAAPAPEGVVHLLVGPEAGLSPAEEALAEKHGAQAWRLGPRILRTETAGLTALAALQALHGDF